MDTHLERNPVYQQLNSRLRAVLASDYQSDDRFLTEREISTRFQVSRATANKALASLVSEGLLEFRRGVGTFVRRNLIDYDLRSLVSFTEKARAAGKSPRTEVLAFATIKREALPPALQDVLECELQWDGNEPLWEMKRLRLADQTPVILEHRFLLKKRCPRLTRGQIAGSLYQVLTQKHGLRIGGADEVIRAVALNREQAAHLQTPVQSPALEITAVGRLEDESPLWWERTLYRADQYEFHSRLGPITSATPPRGKLR